MHNLFDLQGQIAVITGGAGLLGQQHAIAIMSAGGIPVLLGLERSQPQKTAEELNERYQRQCFGVRGDVTSEYSLRKCLFKIRTQLGEPTILINNAANNPAVKADGAAAGRFDRFESFSLDTWNADIAVGLTGAFLASKVFGSHMAANGGGVILNIASELALIAPDQRLYKKPDTPEDQQPVKPVSYPVVKAGMIGLTRYLATYWADKNVRVNAICPGGVYNGQPPEFVEKISKLIPMGRMANVDEYQGAVLYLCSKASSYVTGTILSVDGGRTCW